MRPVFLILGVLVPFSASAAAGVRAQDAGPCPGAPCRPEMTVREYPLPRPPDTHHVGMAAAMDRDRVIVSSNFLITTYEPTATGPVLRSSAMCQSGDGDCNGFGRALALSGDQLAVGIQNADGNAGQLALYEASAPHRFEVASTRRLRPLRADGSELGAALAFDADWLVAAQPFASSNTGEAALYRWPAAGAPMQTATAAEPASHLYAYLGLAIDDSLLVVGCSGERCGSAAGQIFTYTIDGAGTITRAATLRPPASPSTVGAQTAAACGSSLALSAEHLFVSCSLDGADRIDGGALFVYPRSGTTVTDAPTRIAPSDGRQGRFGESVRTSHGVVFASDLEGDRTGAGIRGRVWAFSAEGEPLLRGYEGLRRAGPDEHRMVLATAADTVGHAVVVGAFRASGDQGEATLYHVGHEDGATCARAGDCLSGGCVGEVCGPAPAGSPCDWTVTCAAGSTCVMHVCAAPPGTDASVPADAGPTSDAASGDDASMLLDAAPAAIDGGAERSDGAAVGADAVASGDAASPPVTRPRVPLSCTCRVPGDGTAGGWLALVTLALLGICRARPRAR